MDRRTLVALIGMGSVIPATLMAQGRSGDRPQFGEQTRKYFHDTLETGTLSLVTSQIAQEKARHEWVKRFANYEADEQQGVARIFKALGGEGPSPSEIEQLGDVRTLRGESGESFEKAYLKAQREGHEKLLGIQEAYIKNSEDPLAGDMAKLIQGRIQEHLDLITAIRGELRYARR